MTSIEGKRILAALSYSFTAVYSIMFGCVGYVAVSLMLCLIVVILDFCTGYIASICEGEKRLRSKKMRWTAAKMATYAGTIAMSMIIGSFLTYLDASCRFVTIKAIFFISLFFTWIETVSNFENLQRIFPGSIFVRYILWFLSAEYIKAIPKLERFLKERERKNEPKIN
jgi:phage-related holin